jgi:glycosyltransferase involved in cell wall biosynthesis
MDLSVVIPVYNEEESVKYLYEAVTKSLAELKRPYEILLVDDGSKDKTFLNAISLSNSDSRLKIVKLKRNYGQTTALHAGFQQAKGKVIITMDGDLQNDPDDIPVMLHKMDEGYDIVLGWRHDRKDFFISRKLPSKIANWLVRKVTGIPVKDNGCAIRAYRAEVIKNFPMYSEMHRLMPVITALVGAKFTQIKVKHHPRKFGHSKYGLSRIYKVLLDLVALKTIFSFFYIPLFGFGFLALASGFISFLILLVSILFIFIFPGKSLVTLIGSSALFAALSVFLYFLGIICHLVYRTGNLKIEDLYKIKFRP